MRIFWIIIVLACTAFAQLKGNPENGKSLYVKNGCWECHGYAGQGGNAGARLSQTRLSQVAFLAFVGVPLDIAGTGFAAVLLQQAAALRVEYEFVLASEE